jgi:hypothetical protein
MAPSGQAVTIQDAPSPWHLHLVPSAWFFPSHLSRTQLHACSPSFPAVIQHIYDTHIHSPHTKGPPAPHLAAPVVVEQQLCVQVSRLSGKHGLQVVVAPLEGHVVHRHLGGGRRSGQENTLKWCMAEMPQS